MARCSFLELNELREESEQENFLHSEDFPRTISS